ncbi:hypothetical protein [Burkholderia ubonensis]|uniref:hypothetical protein n=1 Tax=Burkholderia ubonensis TaxID=101571 RepID=UPI000AD07D23|nr:hypothetical protein [Burkholderia ubonensis]
MIRAKITDHPSKPTAIGCASFEAGAENCSSTMKLGIHAVSNAAAGATTCCYDSGRASCSRRSQSLPDLRYVDSEVAFHAVKPIRARFSDVEDLGEHPEIAPATWREIIHAVAATCARGSAAQAAGKVAGMLLDIGFQHLPEEAAYIAGNTLLPVATLTSGGYLGRQLAQYLAPDDGRRQVLYTAIFAALATAGLTALPFAQAGACVVALAGALNNMASSWISACVNNVLRHAGPRLALNSATGHEDALLLLSPALGALVGGLGSTGASALRVSQPWLQGAVVGCIGGATTAITQTLYDILVKGGRASPESPLVTRPGGILINKPDGGAIVSQAIPQTAVVGIPLLFKDNLQRVMCGGAANPVCKATASALASDISKLMVGVVRDAGAHVVPISHPS